LDVESARPWWLAAASARCGAIAASAAATSSAVISIIVPIRLLRGIAPGPVLGGLDIYHICTATESRPDPAPILKNLLTERSVDTFKYASRRMMLDARP
jgi:hypothetical protein